MAEPLIASDAFGILEQLREHGWHVAVHNDYAKQSGVRGLMVTEWFTFWLFTHRDGRYLKGEGVSDYDALLECLHQAANGGFHG